MEEWEPPNRLELYQKYNDNRRLAAKKRIGEELQSHFTLIQNGIKTSFTIELLEEESKKVFQEVFFNKLKEQGYHIYLNKYRSKHSDYIKIVKKGDLSEFSNYPIVITISIVVIKKEFSALESFINFFSF